MAIIRSAANTIKHGKVGETTFYTALGRQIARQSMNNSNFGTSASRTQSQQSNRVRWANLVNFYKVSRSWMRMAFESKKTGQTDYNKLMSINVSASTVYLTRELAAAGAAVAADYIITQGSLPSVSVTKNGEKWVTSIALGNLQIGEETTVAAFTAAVVAANKTITEGMQMSFISYMQDVDSMGVPRLICTPYEVTLDTTNTSPLKDYLPEFCAQSLNGYLATSEDIALGAFAYVISDQRNGKIQVSTQRLITNNASLLAEYSSGTALNAAVDSYGVDESVMLSPESTVAQAATVKPLYIVRAQSGGKNYVANSDAGKASAFFAGSPVIIMSTPVKQEDIVSGTYTTFAPTEGSLTVTANGTSTVNIAASGASSTANLKSLSLVLKDGNTLTISFSNTASGGGGSIVE